MDLNGNIKIKNLHERKDEVARKHGFNDWSTFFLSFQGKFTTIHPKTFDEAIDEAAELYAGQTKKSEPVSLEVEQAANDYAADYSNPHNHKKDLKFSESDIFYIRQSTFKDAIKWQSQQPIKLSQIAFSEPYQNLQREYAELKQKLEPQQPASIAFLSDEEIKTELDKLSISNDAPQIKVDGAIWLQSELRNRVNAVDPDQILNDVLNGFVSGKYKRPTDSNAIAQFVTDYLTPKTK